MIKRISLIIISIFFISLSASFAATIQLPQTGQTNCYNASGDICICGDPTCPPGQDGEIRAGVVWPTTRFSENGDCVSDNLTGLTWSKSSNNVSLTWQEAMDSADSVSLCGYSDWRIPNIIEFLSLVDHNNYSSALSNNHPFLNLQPNYYPSSTTVAYQADNNSIWVFNISDGHIGSSDKSGKRPVWIVRGEGDGIINLPKTGQTLSFYSGDDGDLQKGVVWPVPRFTNPDGTTPLIGNVVLDQLTGLIWTKNAALSSGSWSQALNYIVSMNSGTVDNFGYKDWRLPNVHELRSLMDLSNGRPALPNDHPFLNIQNAHHWSSTTLVSQTNRAWDISLWYGEKYYDQKGYTKLIWAVRNGPIPAFLPNLEVSPSSHDFGGVAVDECSASQQFTITNTGNAELTVTGITLSDTENFQLSINALPCEKTYTSGESCSFDVYFCPKTSGDLSANLTITSDDPDTPTLNLPLTGSAQCNPLNNVYFIGDYAGLYEGIIDNISANNDCCTSVETDIQAATLIDICLPGFPCIKKGVEFWTSIEEIDFDPNVASYKSSTHDVTGGLLADWKLIPPGMHASYEVTFCKPGTVTFELGFSEKAIGITIADIMTSIIPVAGDILYSTIIDFYDDLSNILLISSAINHESNAMNAALSGNKRLALSETVKARIDLLKLIFNKTQMNQLFQAYVDLAENLKLDIADNELQKLILKKWGTTIPIKVFKVFSDAIVLVIQTKGGTAGPIQIKLIAN